MTLSMGFERPDLLVLAPLAALLFAIALGAYWRRLRRLTHGYRAPALRRLLPPRLARVPTARLLCLIAAGVAVGLAAADPVWIARNPDEIPPLDVAIAVDLSLSMSAADVPPTRIVRAREAIARLAEELPSVRFSLVAFAGWPYTILPPTDDPELLRYFSQTLAVELVQPPDRGTAPGEALELAGHTLERRPTPESRKAVLLLSDGGSRESDDVVRAASELAEAGVEVWVGALGSDEGTPLFSEGAPLLDGGRPVTAARDERLLRDVADQGDGLYFDLDDEAGVDALVASLQEVSGDTDGVPAAPVDAPFLLVLLAVPLLLWEAAADAGRGWRADGTDADDETRGTAS